MPATQHSAPVAPALPTSLGEKLLDLIACPGEVFEEVAAAAPTPVNWRLPTLLVCLTNAILLNTAPLKAQAASALQLMAQAPNILPADAVMASSNFQLIATLTACAAAFAGTFWSALVLWFMGRMVLKIRFSYWKSLEVAGLSASILVLGASFTALLMTLSDNVTARPALSLLLLKSHSNDRLRAFLETFNVFHLWTTALLAIGLSKLSATSFKESAFWVFGYWVLLRLLLSLLAG
jgi:hypothetical protein